MRKFSVNIRFCVGYTFVEALVVIAIFTGFVVSTAGVFIMAYRAQATSYHEELAEQANMRGAFELEYLFRSSLGYDPIDSSGDVAPDLKEFDHIRLAVPHWDTGDLEYWEFWFSSDGTDPEGRISGSIEMRAPNMGVSDSYVYDEDVSLPFGRDSLFVLDSLGRLDYHWVVRASDADLDWKGLLVTSQ